MPNPYNYSTMVTDPKMFFGREAILRDLCTRLRNMQSVSIVGMRRIGKSSLLRRLVQTLPDEWGQAFVPLYINLQDARYHTVCDFVSTVAGRLSERLGGSLPVTGVTDMRSFSEVIEQLSCNGVPYARVRGADTASGEESPREEQVPVLRRIFPFRGRAVWQKYRTELRQKLDGYFSEGDLRTLCFDLGVEYDNLPASGKVYKARELVSLLERCDRLPELVEMCRRRRPNTSWEDVPETATQAQPESQDEPPTWLPHFILCLDEFEVFRRHPHEFDDDFFDTLRALGQSAKLAMVTASRRPLVDLSQGGRWTSPFPNIFAQVDLGLLDPDAAQALRRDPHEREGISLSQENESLLEELGGRHPFFLQMACYHLYESLSQPEDVQTDVGDVVRTLFNRDAERHFGRVLYHLNAGEKAALRTVVGQDSRTWSEWASQLGRRFRQAVGARGTRDAETDRLLKRLERLGIVVKKDDESWEAFSVAFTAYVRQRSFPPSRSSTAATT